MSHTRILGHRLQPDGGHSWSYLTPLVEIPPPVISPRPPLPFFTYVALPYLIIALGDALRLKIPGAGFRVAVLGGLTAMWVYAIGARYDTGEGLQNYSIGSTFGSLFFTAATLLLFQDPLRDCRWATQTEDAAAMPLWQRVYWSLCIQTNTRGVGWNYQIAQLTPIPRQTRVQFVLVRVVRMAWHLFLADVFGVYADCNPAVFGQPGLAARSLRSQGFVLALCNTVALCGKSYCVMNIFYDALGMLTVGTGFSEPTSWPTPFGRWRDSYTIRRFWGRTWHQMMRRFVSTIGKATARFLGFTPGTWLSSRTQLIVGFSISGLAHVPGDAMVHPYWTGSSYWFFLYNALAIIVEDLAIDAGKRLGVRDGWAVRMLGYAWTIGWFTYATPWFEDWAMVAGLGSNRAFPGSVVRPALGYVAQATGVDVLGWIVRQIASR